MFVAYYRVSTKRQGQSGLGLEAQQHVVTTFAAGIDILSSFVEVETGKNSNRPELLKALALCRATGATLVVAKLDRLARNVLFTATLMESGVEFVCCDMPSANRMTIHIMAAMAEEEARMISARTKAALQAAKARGVKLGGVRGNGGGWKQCLNKEEMLQKRFETTYSGVIPLVRELNSRGETRKSIAVALNRHGYTTSKGSNFTASTVQRILEKLDGAAC